MQAEEEWGFLSDDLVSSALLSRDPSMFCWGGLLQGNLENCNVGFLPQREHFKNKLCPQCRSRGLVIPSDRIRALDSSDPLPMDKSSHGTGLWTPTGGGANACRLVNHTAKCTGPRLLIYRDVPPPTERASWASMPSGWISENGASVALVSALGTLRPSAAMNRSRTASTGLASSAVAPDKPSMPGCDDSVKMGGSSEAVHALEPMVKRARTSPLSVWADAVAERGDGEASVEDLAAVSAAVSDLSFQLRTEEQLRVCATTFATLDTNGRAVMHGLFCDSTMRHLAAMVGEKPLNRVQAAFKQHEHAICHSWRTLEFTLDDEASVCDGTRLVLTFSCLNDLGTWESIVAAMSYQGMTSGARVSEPGAQMPLALDWLSQLSSTFARTTVDASWQDIVESSLTFLQSTLQDSTSSWHCLSDDACAWTSKFCVSRGVWLSHSDLPIGASQHTDYTPPAGSFDLEARALFDALLEEEGLVRVEDFSLTGSLYELRPSKKASLLEKMLWRLWVGGQQMHMRCLTMQHAEGVTNVLVPWDKAKNALANTLHAVSPSLQPRAGQKPAQSWEHPTGISGFWSTTILFDHGTRRWRFVEAEIDFVPSPFVRSGGDGLHTPLQKLAEIVCRDTKKRMVQLLQDIITERAAAPDFIPIA